MSKGEGAARSACGRDAGADTLKRHAHHERRCGRPDDTRIATEPTFCATTLRSSPGKDRIRRWRGTISRAGAASGPREPAALTRPVAERNELEVLRKSAPAIRKLSPPAPMRAADQLRADRAALYDFTLA